MKPEISFRSFQYTVLSGNCPVDSNQIDLHNKAFRYWSAFWTEVFQQISGEKVRIDDFYRQTMICALTRNDEIAGLHLYSFFRLDSEAALEHSYFRVNYTAQALERLRAKGVRSIMSMEYLTINPSFRQSLTGLPMVPVLSGLGFRILQESGYDAMIAPCRRDLKVDVRAAEHGAEPFTDEFIHHGVPVVNMMTLASRVKPHHDTTVREAIDLLWKSKRDLSGFKFPQRTPNLRRAG